MNNNDELPMPVLADNSEPVLPYLLQEMRGRVARGLRDYGVPLSTNNGRDADKDASDELWDLLFYLMQRRMEQQGYDPAWLDPDLQQIRLKLRSGKYDNLYQDSHLLAQIKMLEEAGELQEKSLLELRDRYESAKNAAERFKAYSNVLVKQNMNLQERNESLGTTIGAMTVGNYTSELFRTKEMQLQWAYTQLARAEEELSVLRGQVSVDAKTRIMVETGVKPEGLHALIKEFEDSKKKLAALSQLHERYIEKVQVNMKHLDDTCLMYREKFYEERSKAADLEADLQNQKHAAQDTLRSMSRDEANVQELHNKIQMLEEANKLLEDSFASYKSSTETKMKRLDEVCINYRSRFYQQRSDNAVLEAEYSQKLDEATKQLQEQDRMYQDLERAWKLEKEQAELDQKRAAEDTRHSLTRDEANVQELHNKIQRLERESKYHSTSASQWYEACLNYQDTIKQLQARIKELES